MPKAPRASFAAESDAHTEVDPTEHLQAFLYLDYNDVLNTGRPDMLEAMCEFLVRVDHIPGDMHITLLSKRKGRRGQLTTLEELDRAGVLDLFDQITFTSERTSRDHQGMTATEHHIYYPTSLPHSMDERSIDGIVSYEVFYGGKDQCIHSYHGRHSNGCVVFVDDKAETLEAVRMLTPRAYAIEMRRHRFFTDPRCYSHVRNLNELYNAIRKICYRAQ